MSRRERIAQIIEQRRPLAAKIQHIESELMTLAEKLGLLEEYRKHLTLRVKDSETQKRLQSIGQISECKDRIAASLRALAKLRKRFGRDTLNIGVVGRMRQGKSTLLQSLSGLTNAEIPARPGGACTAVRSVLYHHDGETQATVRLHSEKSLLEEVIYEYWKALGWKDQGIALPISLEDFAQHDLPNEPDPSKAAESDTYMHLKDYHRHFSEYRSFLQPFTEREVSIKQHEIVEYVSQQRDGHQLVTVKHLAVKEVKIYCRFPKAEEVDRIALVDVPGLGDTKLGDEALMLKTLSEEVDVVLFVRRPDPLGYAWDKEDNYLYDLASEALHQLPQRSFMVLNRLTGEQANQEACETMQHTMRYVMVDSMIENCSDSIAANHVLDRILDHLATQISHLEAQYAASCEADLAMIQQQVKIILENAQRVFGESDSAWEERIDELFDELWNRLAFKLTKKLSEIETRRSSPNRAFEQKLEETIEGCKTDSGIPSTDDIEVRIAALGAPTSAYNSYLHEIRLHLSQRFFSLDEGLKQSLDEVRAEIASVLQQDGRLSSLSGKQGAEFLKDISSQIAPGSTKNKLKNSFEIFASFDLLYRGMIQHRIRPELDRLTPGRTECPQAAKDASPPEILEILTTMHRETVEACDMALQNLLIEPSQAVFAIAEEFVDGLLRAKGVKREWEHFLKRNRTKIWSEEFAPIAELAESRRQWNELFDQAEAANQFTLRLS